MLGVAPQQAEELCQECFVRLFNVLHKEEKVQNARAWLFKTSHNLAINHLESHEVQQRHATEWIDAVIERKIDPQPNPEQAALEHERFVRLHRAVAALSPQQKQCLFLRAEGFRYREIAEMTGLSINTVVEFLRRGIARLKKLNL
jgi:RNA polymerase sigma-70 factor (ECF subfamily)